MDLPAAPLLLFDGFCALCSGVVRFVLRRDREGSIRYAPIQSPLGSRLLQAHGLAPDSGAPQTLLFLAEGRAFVRSDAALEIARRLRAPWSAAAILRALPRAWRDGLYTAVASHRYRWFGRRDRCFVPSAEERSRFLDGLDG
jgi:predicted DCC family thiol-disulfide oxidoreductase YuxK